MDLLKRQLAPIVPEAWKLIDEEARRVLRLNLAGRRLVGIDGPHALDHAAANLGRLKIFDEQPRPNVHAGLREVQPLLELRTPLKLDLMELDSVSRGLDAPDLGPVVEASERLAQAEDHAVFNGYEEAGIRGILEATSHDPVTIPGDPERWPHVVVEASEVLREADIDGPYALALGPRAYGEVARAAEDGYPIGRRVEDIVGNAPVRAPSIDGAVLLSQRGGDFVLTIGEDIAIGYADHDRDAVELYLAESFTFRVQEPDAAVALRFES